MNKLIKFLIAVCFTGTLFAQQYKLHSHNDYMQKVPFWNAFSAGANSIEADILLKDGQLYVAHSEESISKERTIESLYLEPLQAALNLKLLEDREVQILIDIKTKAKPTLQKLVETLSKYPLLIASDQIDFVISGNQPKPSEYHNYPDYIHFDYQSLTNLNAEEWQKIALISLDFNAYSHWNGKGRLTKEDLVKVEEVVTKAHSYNKPFRFWGTPDSKTAWRAFYNLGVEFINTDKPFESNAFLKTLERRTYVNDVFSEVYHPTFEFDKKEIPVKNVILLIGDGNGLTEISSSVLANGGELTLSQLKSIGMIKTSSSDDFTTDSAAAGSAIATGKKTYNRAIGVDSLGNAIPNMAEVLQQKGFSTGVITTDDITGATPAAFYAHQKDREMSKEIALDLLRSKLTLFSGGGRGNFKELPGFKLVNDPVELSNETNEPIGYFMSEKGVPSVLHGRNDLFPITVEHSLTYLKNQKKPFFLMAEGAQIDSHGHFNDVSGIVSEGIDFDRAITAAIKFADENPGTLVIITADHETSGFSLPQGNLKKHLVEGDFTTYDHTATLVPVFAYGPHSGLFTGIYENNEIFDKIMSLLK